MAGVPKQKVLDFLGDPHRPDQKIDQALKKRRFIPLDKMTQKKQSSHPIRKSARPIRHSLKHARTIPAKMIGMPIP
jgi:hypothetical protein